MVLPAEGILAVGGRDSGEKSCNEGVAPVVGARLMSAEAAAGLGGTGVERVRGGE
jgi:hypothetical protein